MTDHLPECGLFEPCYDGNPHDMNYSGWDRCYACEVGCICDRLRACEQRVLDAAREAVAGVGVRKDTSHDMRVQALAAIDALREKP